MTARDLEAFLIFFVIQPLLFFVPIALFIGAIIHSVLTL
jgi:hypothetical protein